MNPSLIWQIIVTLLTSAFTVGMMAAGVSNLKKAFAELKDEVKELSGRTGKLEIRVAILELPLRKLLMERNEP